MIFNDIQLVYLVLDSLVYLLTFFYFLGKAKGFTIGSILLLIFAVSHICGIPYYLIFKSLGEYIDVKPIAYIFLFAMTMLTIYPLLNFHGVKYIKMKGLEPYVRYFVIFIFIISLLPLFENIEFFIRNGGSSSDFGELYQMKREGTIQIYSKLGSRFMWIAGMFKIVILGTLFYYIRFYSKRKMLVWMLIIIEVNYLLNGINLGSRGAIASTLLMFVSCYLLLNLFYTQTMKRKLARYFLIVAIPALLLISLMTSSRYNAMNTSVTFTGWVVRYLGEGPVNFSTLMWDGKHNTNGDVNLNYFKSLLGMKTYKTYDERDEHYLNLNGRRIEIFYTYIGDFLSDFGYAGCVIVCLLVFLIIKLLLKKQRGAISFENYIIAIIFLNLYVLGFASNVYRSYNMQMNIVVTLICVLALRFLADSSEVKLPRRLY